jgi:hypothetical protein
MYSYLLQDWTTLRGDVSVTALSQGENGWLDLSAFQDVVAWLQVKEVTPTSGSLQLAYQTAPTKDDALFVAMAPALAIAGPGLTTTAMLKFTTATPLTRWMRWQIALTSAAAWDVTFRIFLACNAVGANRAQVLAEASM